MFVFTSALHLVFLFLTRSCSKYQRIIWRSMYFLFYFLCFPFNFEFCSFSFLFFPSFLFLSEILFSSLITLLFPIRIYIHFDHLFFLFIFLTLIYWCNLHCTWIYIIFLHTKIDRLFSLISLPVCELLKRLRGSTGRQFRQ